MPYDPDMPKRSSYLLAVFESAATGLRSGNLRGMGLPNTFANARTIFQLKRRSSCRASRAHCGDVHDGNLEIPCLKLL
jgi:hypothetical protein